jgi:hypothetical protein
MIKARGTNTSSCSSQTSSSQIGTVLVTGLLFRDRDLLRLGFGGRADLNLFVLGGGFGRRSDLDLLGVGVLDRVVTDDHVGLVLVFLLDPDVLPGDGVATAADGRTAARLGVVGDEDLHPSGPCQGLRFVDRDLLRLDDVLPLIDRHLFGLDDFHHVVDGNLDVRVHGVVAGDHRLVADLGDRSDLHVLSLGADHVLIPRDVALGLDDRHHLVVGRRVLADPHIAVVVELDLSV